MQQLNGKRVLVLAGGTGGHIFPALAIAKALMEQGATIHWLGTKKGLEADIIPKHQIPLHYISITGFRGKGLKTLLSFPFRLALSLWQSIQVIRTYRPHLVIGMGGFVSGPGGVAAWLLGIPLVIHEQNAIAGKTNQYLSRIAKKTCEAFPGTFPQSMKALFTGNPVRQELLGLPAKTRHDAALNILVLGGSRGARALNQIVPEAIGGIAKKQAIHIWHQTGQQDFEQTEKQYQRYQALLHPKVMPFIDDIQSAYRWADLVICRSGALTVSELALVGLPSILVPFPHAVDDHQTKNGAFLTQKGAAIMLPQSQLTKERLTDILEDLTSNRSRLLKMSDSARQLGIRDAIERVVDTCREVCHA